MGNAYQHEDETQAELVAADKRIKDLEAQLSTLHAAAEGMEKALERQRRMIGEATKLLSAYLPPDGASEALTLSELIELFDNQEQRDTEKATRDALAAYAAVKGAVKK